MASFKSLVFASSAVVVLMPSAGLAAPAMGEGVVLVAAEPQPAAVIAAEQAVSDARAALRRAMASGKGLREARAGLAAALKQLEEAKLGGGGVPAIAAPAQPPLSQPAAPAPARSAAKPEPPAVQAGAAGGGADQSPVATPTAAAVTGGVAAVEPAKPIGIGEKTVDGRVILRENGQLVVSHDEDARLVASGGRVTEAAAGNGERFVTVDLPDGSQVVTVRDGQGNVVRRTLRLQKGQSAVLIDANPASAEEIAAGLGDVRAVPPVARNSLPGQYWVDGGRATAPAIEAALAAPPVATVDRAHTLAEIRGNARLRDALRRVDIDTLNFDDGKASLADGEVGKLDAIGGALASILAAKRDEIFLIEGHTDAVGSDLAGLLLSDRRAETVAEILTRAYNIPPENLVTQGYGEQYLKVPTQAAEPRNRRITIRRITPLLGIGNGV